MNSRMPFGGGYFYLPDQQFQLGSSWLPVTQDMPPSSATSQPVLINGYGNNSDGGNWDQLSDLYGQIIQGEPSYSSASQFPDLQQANHTEGSYVPAIRNGTIFVNTVPQANCTEGSYAPAIRSGTGSDSQYLHPDPQANCTGGSYAPAIRGGTGSASQFLDLVPQANCTEGSYAQAFTNGTGNTIQFLNPLPQVSCTEGSYAQAFTNGSGHNIQFFNAVPPVTYTEGSQAQSIRSGSDGTVQFFVPVPLGNSYAQLIGSGSAVSNASLLAHSSAEITAPREHLNMTLGTNASVQNNHLNSRLLPYGDNYVQPISSSLSFDNSTQPLSSTSLSNTAYFNQMHHSDTSSRNIALQLPSMPADDNHRDHSNESRGSFQAPTQHNYNLNQPPDVENANPCNANLLGVTPVTPDKSRKLEKQRLSVRTESTRGRQILEAPTENEAIGHCSDGLLGNVVDSSSTAAPMLSGETKEPGKGSDQGIDLNKTPHHKGSKRKKHRPKVVSEGKSKKPSKTTATTSMNSNDRSSGKRKYVRRKDTSEPASQKADARKKTASANAERTKRSCKRSLNFDLQNGRGESSENTVHRETQQMNMSFDLNSVSQDHGLCARYDSGGNMDLGMQISRQCTLKAGNQEEKPQEEILEYSRTADQILPYPINTMFQEASWVDESHMHRASANATSEGSQKKMKVEKRVQTDMHLSLPNLLDGYTKAGTSSAASLTAQARRSILDSSSGSNNPKRQNNGVNSNSTNDSVYSQMHAGQSHTTESEKLAQVHSSISKTATEKCKLSPSTPAKINPPAKANDTKRRPAKRSAKKKKGETAMSATNVPEANGALQNKGPSLDFPHSLEKTRDETKTHIYPPHVEEVTKLLNSLRITATAGQDETALVPYGGSAAIVLLGTKKKKPRPKVDLDTKTIRIWNILMGIEGNPDSDTQGKGSESWWENERNVFCGRADSFIARMRLVQGDRHFSRWKGSVVDSVIGVFLTQNVSDHLSSSAFMNLAAHFPLKLKSSNGMRPQDGRSILVEEPEDCMPHPDEPVTWHKRVSCLSPYGTIPIIPHDSTEHHKVTGMPGTGIQSFEEEIVSSQDSQESSVVQGIEAIRSYSGSNSEAEDPISGGACNRKYESTSTDVPLLRKATPFEDIYISVTGSALSDQRFSQGLNKPVTSEHEQPPISQSATSLKEASVLLCSVNSNNLQTQSSVIHSGNSQLNTTAENGVLEERVGEESSSSWPSPSSGLSNAIDMGGTSRRTGQATDNLNSYAEQSQSAPISQGTPLMEHSSTTNYQSAHQQSTSKPKSQTANHQQSNMNSQLESTSVTRQVESSTKQYLHNAPNLSENSFDAEERVHLGDKQRKLENIAVGPNLKEQSHFSATASMGKNTSTSTRRKGKAGGQRKSDEYWESLRRQVVASCGKKERSHDTMDSMDYEAIRHASVQHISDVIIERGMNNMLAERIKEFLNQLVRVHGSIDLEWLRDVPPDEAKDYLLSIWGIGLKSVECVRLLTLHHLAFPVDTNVGRIAVRLGWVPLQPLPESLQLHLLEMYPILESIQKYLWPRLCNLDQQTLYELHYHLITFGKVFCTKKNPNCNACPMRGECRHFASAFASARLALPGPEEKSIVSSNTPGVTEADPPPVINSVQQILAEDNSHTGASSDKGMFEPIIEEPDTPEPESTEVLENDIEDAFWEDPDDIPTITLNMEEFTSNLQNYMQANNMDLQEGDVCKALVALTAEAASIPAPKLKNVNRLRTEHQVYELPDLHPLLERMDRREADDPSPYLLAIWTPGETENSIQPPERKCASEETGQLCNQETCFRCNGIRESESQTVRGTLLIPCRTAMRGRFPLNGTYFQVNEVFADDETSKKPLTIPRSWLWNLATRTVYFGTSVTSIFRGLSTDQIQFNFWRGFVCVRGFHRETKAQRPLVKRLHYSAHQMTKEKSSNVKARPSNNKGAQKKESSRSSSNKRKKNPT